MLESIESALAEMHRLEAIHLLHLDCLRIVPLEVNLLVVAVLVIMRLHLEYFAGAQQHLFHLEIEMLLDCLKIARQQQILLVEELVQALLLLEHLDAAREQAIVSDFLQQAEHLKIVL